MDNIAFGQYIPGKSWIYKLDPRVKIILTIALVVLIFLIPSLKGILIALLVYLLVFFTTRISFVRVLKGLKPILFLLVFTFVLQILYTKGTTDTLLKSFPMQIGMWQCFIFTGMLFIYIFTKKYLPFKFLYLLLYLVGVFLILWLVRFDNFVFTNFHFDVYKEGINKASYLIIRIALMIGLTSLLTLTTMSMDINHGLEAVLSPLKLIKIPVGVFSMLVALTLRFIPTLLNESKKIMSAQASRGVDFKEGSLKQKVNQIVSLLIPMFVISFKKAEDLSDAMEARGYVIGAKRTSLIKLKLRWRDYFAIFITVCLFSIVIYFKIKG